MNSSTRGLGHKSSFVETNIYTGHILITLFNMINTCLSKKLFLKLSAMKVHGQQWGFIGLLSCCSVNWVGKQCMHQGGARISIPRTLLNFIILDCQWLLFISITRGKAALVEDEDSRNTLLSFFLF